MVQINLCQNFFSLMEEIEAPLAKLFLMEWRGFEACLAKMDLQKVGVGCLEVAAMWTLVELILIELGA